MKKDRLTRYLEGLGESRKMNYFSERSGVSEARLVVLRDEAERPLKYVEALRLVHASSGSLNMRDFDDRRISDRDRYDTPLGRKIAASLLDGPKLTQVLEENDLSYKEFKRILCDNVSWHEATRKKVAKMFSRNGVKITDLDFEEHRVDRLYARFRDARNDLAAKGRNFEPREVPDR